MQRARQAYTYACNRDDSGLVGVETSSAFSNFIPGFLMQREKQLSSMA